MSFLLRFLRRTENFEWEERREFPNLAPLLRWLLENGGYGYLQMLRYRLALLRGESPPSPHSRINFIRA